MGGSFGMVWRVNLGTPMLVVCVRVEFVLYWLVNGAKCVVFSFLIQFLGLCAGVCEGHARLQFGSCSKTSFAQPLWSVMGARSPQAWVWGGDVVYADTGVFLSYRIPGTPEEIERQYRKQAARSEYASYLSRTNASVFGVWDDHDAGKNDADRSFEHIGVARKAFLDFIGAPADSPRRQGDAGLFATHYLLFPKSGEGAAKEISREEVRGRRRGEGGGDGDEFLVRLVLLDNRWAKDGFDVKGGDMLGEAQWALLRRELETEAWNDEFHVTLVMAGLQMLSRSKLAVAETFFRHPRSQARLLALVGLGRAKRVVLLSGDVHYAEISRLACKAVGYPLFDVTSSGMTHSWRGPILSPLIHYYVGDHLRPPTAPHMFDGLNFGEIDIDAKFLNASILTTDNTPQIQIQIPLQLLQRPPNPPTSSQSSSQPPSFFSASEPALVQFAAEQSFSDAELRACVDAGPDVPADSLAAGGAALVPKACQRILDECAPIMDEAVRKREKTRDYVLAALVLLLLSTALLLSPYIIVSEALRGALSWKSALCAAITAVAALEIRKI